MVEFSQTLSDSQSKNCKRASDFFSRDVYFYSTFEYGGLIFLTYPMNEHQLYKSFFSLVYVILLKELCCFFSAVFKDRLLTFCVKIHMKIGHIYSTVNYFSLSVCVGCPLSPIFCLEVYYS